jgi:hypothetical protein
VRRVHARDAIGSRTERIVEAVQSLTPFETLEHLERLKRLKPFRQMFSSLERS